ncbi:MAG: hypothetical protein KU28_00145 [Sulfurovum sp. PC08-66]|nr:MAG: hypothetical protein KU28_00145 [Sulfurovum sp. PC08-66]KIM12384.1 MAG: hypothetical protein KU37_00265 [Sulfuricurvum sp. PC08-66]
MPLPTPEEVIKAKTLFGLHDSPTLDEIKIAYRNLMHDWHPDKRPDATDTSHATAINEAYEMLMEFCKAYRYDLSEHSIHTRAQTPQSWWQSRFGPR